MNYFYGLQLRTLTLKTLTLSLTFTMYFTNLRTAIPSKRTLDLRTKYTFSVTVV